MGSVVEPTSQGALLVRSRLVKDTTQTVLPPMILGTPSDLAGPNQGPAIEAAHDFAVLIAEQGADTDDAAITLRSRFDAEHLLDAVSVSPG
jgi:hypothetical protein